MRRTLATARATKSSNTLAYTYTRSTPTQFWPEFWKVPRMATATAEGMSAVSQTMKGSLPPSSRTSGVRG